jgi:hypothetical protein
VSFHWQKNFQMSEMTKFSIKTYRELLHLFLNDGILIAQGHHAKTQNSKPREWAFLMDLINHVQHPQITKKTIRLKNCFFKHLPCKNIQHGLKQTTKCQSGGLWIVRSIYLQSSKKIIMVFKIGFTLWCIDVIYTMQKPMFSYLP